MIAVKCFGEAVLLFPGKSLMAKLPDESWFICCNILHFVRVVFQIIKLFDTALSKPGIFVALRAHAKPAMYPMAIVDDLGIALL